MTKLKFYVCAALAALCTSAGAQTYRQVNETDLITVNGVTIGQSCETLQRLIDQKVVLSAGLTCSPLDHPMENLLTPDKRVFAVYLTPERTVWKITYMHFFPDNAKPRIDSALQSLYSRFGRPLLEQDFGNQPGLPAELKTNSFNKSVLTMVWSSKNPNPASTLNTNIPSACSKVPRSEVLSCATQAGERSNAAWEKDLSKVRGVITVVGLHSDSVMNAFTIEMYDQAQQARMVTPQEIEQHQRDKEQRLIPKF